MGRRLAFDQAKGRLWVICERCSRWNLTPLEERWEAIEVCEKLYRDATKRVATDEIGLAKVNDGLALVRIGRPVFPEYASWRYGERFARRHRRATMVAVGAGIGAGAIYIGAGAMMGFGSVMTAWYLYQSINAFAKSRLRLPYYGTATTTVGRPARITRRDLDLFSLVGTKYGPLRHEGPEEWTLRRDAGGRYGEWYVAPEQAPAVLGKVIVGINAEGQDDRGVEGGIELYEQWSGRVLENAVPLLRGTTSSMRLSKEPALALALEMSLNEDQERRWLTTELHLLEGSWKEAEELARVADDLTLPEWVAEKLGRLKGGA